jgi:hypothetical protein
MVKFEISITKRHLYALVGLVTALLLILPTASWASHTFTDVPDSNVFHDDISWLADAGVTLGCNPPANDQYCPGDTVRRDTMAAFMRRLAENKVVDAATAVQAQNADTATMADDSDLLDGKDSAEFLEQGDQFSVAWLKVDDDGTILSQSGGFTVTNLGIDFGTYQISHAAVDLQAVGFVGSSFNPSGSGTTPTSVSMYHSDPGTIIVNTKGTDGLTFTDHAFSLVFPLLDDTGAVPATPADIPKGSSGANQNQ